MTADAEHLLEALQRFFLLSYREEAQRRMPAGWTRLPLAVASHVDVVAVNGGRRAHFLFAPSPGDRHKGRMHDVTVAGQNGDAEREKAFVARQFRERRPVVHFVVRPPFDERFERVGRVARESVADHLDRLRAHA